MMLIGGILLTYGIIIEIVESKDSGTTIGKGDDSGTTIGKGEDRAMIGKGEGKISGVTSLAGSIGIRGIRQQ